MRFLPFEDAPIDREPTIREAEIFCRSIDGILNHVYLFNSPGSERLHTRCPGCGEIVLRHEFFGPMGAKYLPPEAEATGGGKTFRPAAPPSVNRCPTCTRPLAVVGPVATATFIEADFHGGYPLTRALDIVAAMLIAMGVTRRTTVARAWEDLLGEENGLQRLHHATQGPRRHIEALRRIGGRAGVTDRAGELADFLVERLDRLETALAPVTRRPRVYYAMGTPLFHLSGGRLENRLAEYAGGISVNRELPPGGRPGHNLTAARLAELNPDIIVISAFLTNRVEDFHADCLRLGLGEVNAVRFHRIHTYPAPGWDFGSPRWILGLMHLARIFHPEHCAVDIMTEARKFYRRFYGSEFSLPRINRSFAKPADSWRWEEDDGILPVRGLPAGGYTPV